jgi:hypothetical protein
MVMAEATPRPSVDDRIRAALWFAERGFGVFPVWSADTAGACRCPKGAACDNAGKHPLTAHGFQDATRDTVRIGTFLAAGSEPNYGLVPPEGMFALDVDGDGMARLAELESKLGPLPPTLRTRTPHGEHIFLRWPDGLPRPTGQLFGFVTRWHSGSNAGYVVGPRSVHASGAQYEPLGDAYEIAELPTAWTREFPQLRPLEIVVSAGAYEMPDRIPAPESRYGAIRSYVAHLYNSGLSTLEMWPLVRDVLAPRFEQPLTEPELRSRFERTATKLSDRLGARRGGAAVEEPDRRAGPGIDAADLLLLDLAPLRWIVPDLLPEGTTVLAASPKVGKSCLVYQLVIEVSIGGDLLGRRVTPGSCLYLALEDGQRRGQDRLRTALAGRTLPAGRLEIRWEARHIGKGLEDDLTAWLDAHADAAVVAIDTLQKVRAHADSRRNAYEVDVEDLGRLQNLFRDRNVSLLIVHHLRKQPDDDFLASVSGTYGITGSADTILVIRRKRLETLGKLSATGRDIEEANLSVNFTGGLWSAAPVGSEFLAGARSERSRVYELIREQGPIYPAAIADQIGLLRPSVARMVKEMSDDGAIQRIARGYVVNGISLNTYVTTVTPGPLNTHVTTVTPDPSTSNDSNWGHGARARASETGWIRPCRDYSNHQASHRQTPEGWLCVACYPVAGETA